MNSLSKLKESTSLKKLDTPVLTELTIGDWSEDGHCRYNKIQYYVNYAISDIRQAYKSSCLMTGVQFNHNQNYTGTGEGYIFDQICTEYENNCIREKEFLCGRYGQKLYLIAK